MTSTRIALVTCQDLPDLDADDQPLKAALEAKGATVTTPIWDDPKATWDKGSVDLVVLRNTWDYSTKYEAFLAFVDAVGGKNRLLNSPAVIKANTDKVYLRQISQAGLNSVRSVFLDKGDTTTFGDVAARLTKAEVPTAFVIKPRVGAGSRDTIKVDNTDEGRAAGQAFLADVGAREALMVQAFLPAVAQGEASLMFIDGRYSHAVNKTPKEGDFRSQPEFGSTVATLKPDDEQFALAERTVALLSTGLSEKLLYARIDMVKDLDGRWAVIEAELTEPSMYLTQGKDAAVERFADAILARATA